MLKMDDHIVQELNNLDCLIIDSFNNNIEEKLFYSILNQSKQLEKFILYNSNISINKTMFKLEDLKSRINSFIFIGIELPTDDLLKVIISKTLSDKQISINPKISDFIINNVDRSYENMIKFLKEVDELSLSTGKSININLIKKVLKMNKYRTHNCSELGEKDINKVVQISGWLHRKRSRKFIIYRFKRPLWNNPMCN